jgi:hypothetical protein
MKLREPYRESAAAIRSQSERSVNDYSAAKIVELIMKRTNALE